MGGVVKQWITEKLGLEVPPANDPPAFRMEVANGILIAEILRKYGILSDDEFVSLQHVNTKKSRHSNMKHLYVWLTQAGMEIQQLLLVDIADERAGSAIKFLYELYLWLENGPRKPKVGDRAKKYLTVEKTVPMWEDGDTRHSTLDGISPKKSPVPSITNENGDSRRSTISTSVGWGAKLQAASAAQPKGKEIIKKPNWYSSLDKIIAPPLVKQMRPFAELSEAAQAQALYFAKESLEIMEKQLKQYNRVETDCEEQIKEQYYFVGFKSKIDPVEFSSTSTAKLKKQSEEYKSATEDIRKFDRKLKANKKAGKIASGENTIIYRNGKGSPEEMEKNLRALKERRQKDIITAQCLAKCRKAASHRILEGVQAIYQEGLQETVMKTISNLPYREQLIADFIFNSHLEKACFLQHAVFDARERQWARDFDLAKEVQIEQDMNALKKSIHEHRTQQLSKKDRDEMDQEMKRLTDTEKFLMIFGMMDDLINAVITTVDYRAAMGNASFGTDVFRDAIDNGDGVQASITLQDESYAMEPKLKYDPAVRAVLPPPPQPYPVDEGHFLAHHIAVLLDKFIQFANGGSLIPMKAFTLVIEDLILLSKRKAQGEIDESLPPAWLRLSSEEIERIVYLLMGKRGYINWRNFLMACMDLPLPTQEQIISILNQFRQHDPAGVFFIDKRKYDSVPFWFEPNPPCVLSEAFRSLHCREIIFFMFADQNGYFYYVDFLLHLCKDKCFAQGIAKALAVLTGRTYSTKILEKKCDKTVAVLLTDTDLEQILENLTSHEKDKPHDTAPPNTPRRHRGRGHHHRGKAKEKVIHESEKNISPVHKGERRHSKTGRRKSLKGKTNSDSAVDPDHHPHRKHSIGSHRPHTAHHGKKHKEKEKHDSPKIDKQEIIESQKRKHLEEVPQSHKIQEPEPHHDPDSHDTNESEEQEEEEGSVTSIVLSESDQPANNMVPAEAFLQAMWFGHITSYPVEDSSFVSVEYLKMKEFIDLVYGDLCANNLASHDGETYSAPLQHLLTHPFVAELIKRFATYKVVSMDQILKEVRPLTDELGMYNESPPASERNHFLPSDMDYSEAEYEEEGQEEEPALASQEKLSVKPSSTSLTRKSHPSIAPLRSGVISSSHPPSRGGSESGDPSAAVLDPAPVKIQSSSHGLRKHKKKHSVNRSQIFQ